MVLLLMDYTYCAEFENRPEPHIVHGSLRYIADEDIPLDVLKKKLHALVIAQCRPAIDYIVAEHVCLSHVREANKWLSLESL